MKKALLLILFTLQVSHALVIFDNNGNLTQEYYTLDFSSGDRPSNGEIILDDGKRFLFVDFLGAGSSTNVLKVQDPDSLDFYALRLPIKNDRFNKYTLQTYPILQKYSIRIPTLYSSFSDKYILNEIIDFDFNMDYFFENLPNLPEDIKLEAQNALFDFANKTAMFSEISDFNGTQLVYSSKEKSWILLDWTNQVLLFRSNKKDSLFTEEYLFVEPDPMEFSEEAKLLLAEVKEEIYKTRMTFLIKDNNFFEKAIYNPTKEKIFKVKNYLWKSFDFKEKFRSYFFIDNLEIIEKMSLTPKEIDALTQDFKFINSEALPILKMQLKGTETLEEFVTILKKNPYVFIPYKKDLLIELKDHFERVGGNEVDFQNLLNDFETKAGACFKKVDIF